MAFDQSTRNRLQRFVTEARALLADEFTRQLQATYGMNPNTGEVADIDTLTGLTPHQQETAQLLRDTLSHYLANAEKGKEKAQKTAALGRIVREQAFTILNRLAALRMSEARGFLIESIAKGYESKGFQLFHRLAGTSLGETGDAYQHYVYSLFDEFSLDLAVLFDRFSVQGRLFPSHTKLLELLALINHDEINPLWIEDETVGWIYQYFNSIEERRQMRAESQAPRNSRELAVRNQFFTPRYVVEFLTDNTLGRIWYEMTQGNTGLKTSCKYLVRRPNELFLAQHDTAPEQLENLDLSQEQLLQQTVYIDYRKLKDPRDIRMLDPACGSMHFGLYAFDLFEAIYSEAWDIEIAQGTEAFIREPGRTPLTSEYADKAEFLRHVPRLIIEHNIHGVDIDPRAAQIAGLSLWLRAHNSWQKSGIKPVNRPKIQRSNIVCAEPMPGEKALLQEFTATLKPTVLGQLVEVIFEKMALAGEAGSLLKIEEEIQNAIAEAKQTWQDENKGLFQFADFAKIAKQRGELDFDVSDINDEGFWEQAEQKILDALQEYAEKASTDEIGQKRLFSEDAAKGFALIELCRKRFDVVLMNPPFGESVTNTKDYITKKYLVSKNDLYSSFVERGTLLLNPCGVLGAITNKTGFFLQTFQGWRSYISTVNNHLEIAVDLGFGVLDTAMVETMAYIIKHADNINSKHTSFVRLTNEDNKQALLLEVVNRNLVLKNVVWSRDIKNFNVIPYNPFCYWVSTSFLSIFAQLPSFTNVCGHIYQGIATGDNFRFLRTRWEIPEKNFSQSWPGYVKGGASLRWYSPIKLTVNWKNNGQEIKANAQQCYGSASRTIKNESSFFKKGSTYTQVTVKGFGVRLMPNNCIFDMKGPFIDFEDDIDEYFGIGVMSSLPFRTLARLITDNRQWHPTNIMHIPFPYFDNEYRSKITTLTKEVIELSSIKFRSDETSGIFSGVQVVQSNDSDTLEKISYIENQIDLLISDGYGVSLSEFEDLNKLFTVEILINTDEDSDEEIINSFSNSDYYPVLSYILGVYFRRWDSKRTDLQDYSDLFVLPESLNHSNADISVIHILETDYTNSLSNILRNSLKLPEQYNSILGSNSNNDKFFDYHLSIYSDSRRQAPIYWPLETQNSSYALWVYYHRINEQSLYICINDFIEPKLNTINLDLTTLRNNISRSKNEEKEFDRLTDFKVELEDFRDELLRIAKFWKPNLNDGVQITAAPLWRLFRHKAWQEKLKATWKQLEAGDYDWAHLAYSIWPARVLRKCHKDRSLAIAHEVEQELWHEVQVIKGRSKNPVWEWQPKPLSEAELTAYIQSKIQA